MASGETPEGGIKMAEGEQFSDGVTALTQFRDASRKTITAQESTVRQQNENVEKPSGW